MPQYFRSPGQLVGGGVGYRNSMPVAPGWGHGAANSPAQAAALGKWMAGIGGRRTTPNRGSIAGWTRETPTWGQRFGSPGAATTTSAANSYSSAMMGGVAPVRTTIDGSRDMYGPDYIQRLTNRAVTDARMAGSPRGVMKKFMRPGMSRDEGTLSAAMPEIAGREAEARHAMGATPLLADLANRFYRLEGQQAQASEANQLGRLLSTLQGTRDYESTALLDPLVTMFQRFMGR